MAERNGFRLGRSSTLVQWAVAGFTWNTVNISAFFGGAVFIYANSGGARLALVPMICIGLVVLAGYLVRMAYKAHYTDWRRGAAALGWLLGLLPCSGLFVAVNFGRLEDNGESPLAIIAVVMAPTIILTLVLLVVVFRRMNIFRRREPEISRNHVSDGASQNESS